MLYPLFPLAKFHVRRVIVGIYFSSCKVIWKWQVFPVFQTLVNMFFTIFISTIPDIYSLNNLHLIWSVLWKWWEKSGHKHLSAIHTTLIKKKCIQLCPNTLVWSYHTVLFLLYRSYCTHNPSTTIKIIIVISNTGYRLHNLEPVSCNLSCSLLTYQIYNNINSNYSVIIQGLPENHWATPVENRHSLCQLRLQQFRLVM